MHSTPCSSSSGQTASHSAPKPPRSPRQKRARSRGARASASTAPQRVGVRVGAAEDRDPGHRRRVSMRSRAANRIAAMSRAPRIAILGAGPIGLEAALAAAERGWTSPSTRRRRAVGGHVRRWGHVRTVHARGTMNVSPRARAGARRRRARRATRCPPATSSPTACSSRSPPLPALRGRLRLGTRVLAIGREGLLKHEAIGDARARRAPVPPAASRGPDGERGDRARRRRHRRTGTYGNPNRLGDGGIAGRRRARASRTASSASCPRSTAEPDALGGPHDPAHRLRALRADRRARARRVRARRAGHARRLGRAPRRARLRRRRATTRCPSARR